jgi:hypothetical protein
MWIDRVAVEVDDSEGAERAARWTARQLAPRSEVVLVHVGPEGVPPPAWTAEFVAREAGRVRVVSRRGDPAAELGAAAFHEGADLAVVPPSLRGTAERAELASPVPVVAVGDDPGGRIHRAVLMMDPSPATEAAMAWGVALRDGLGAQVIPCAAVVGWGEEEIRRAAWRALWGGDPAAEERDAMLRWVCRRLEEGGLPEAREHVRVGAGSPAAVLSETAAAVDAGVIVLATDTNDPHGRALRREVLRRATLPVLLADLAHVRPQPLRAAAQSRTDGGAE